MRNKLLFIFLALILVTANALIMQKENILANGQMVLLDLRPKDPRSLLSGDYMELDFAINRNVRSYITDKTADGYVVIRLDDNNIAEYVRIYSDNKPLQDGEMLLRFRKRHDVVQITTNAFHFQEGWGKYYDVQGYGEIRLDESGDAVLVGMRDRELNVIDPEKIIEEERKKAKERMNQ